MPELPEVENVVRSLRRQLPGNPVIEKIEFQRKDLRDPIPIKILKTLEGQKLEDLFRRAKYIILKTAGGNIISHLGMTGTWRKNDGKLLLHDHIKIYFSNQLEIIYNDPRRFGIFDFDTFKKPSPRFLHLGLEPLEDSFTAEYLLTKLQQKSSAIKVSIMAQEIVVGVGNIYASEALFRAGIRPKKSSQRLNQRQAEKLVASIKEVLLEAIASGGSTISDYRNTDGSSGDFQSKHRVYDRGALPCLQCQTLIKQITLGGRSSYFCPSCQS